MLPSVKNKLTLKVLGKLREGGMPEKGQIEPIDAVGFEEESAEEDNPSGEVTAKTIKLKKPKI